MPQRAIALIAIACTAAIATEVHAIGFGRLNTSAVLGQTLDLPVPLRLDAGESIEPGCISAEVMMGDRTLARGQVRARLEPGGTGNTGSSTEWIARISTTVTVDEPVIELSLTVGCDRKFSRRFVAFADPPSMLAGMQPAVQPPRAGVASGVPPAANAAKTPNAAGSTAEGATSPPSKTSKARRPSRDHAAAASAPSAKPRSAARRPAPVVVRTDAPQQVRARDEGARLMLDVAGPRLKLDLEDPVFMPPLQPAGSASGAGELAAAAGNAAEPAEVAEISETERLKELEKKLAALKSDKQAESAAAAAAIKRMSETENRAFAVPWLVALLALSLGVSAWLAFRLKRQQDGSAEEPPPWWTPEAAKPEPVGDEDSFAHVGLDIPLHGDAEPEPRPREFVGEHTAPLPATFSMEDGSPPDRSERVGRVQPAVAEGPYEQTNAMPGPLPAQRIEVGEVSTREVSVEELLDLEQQADFFIALGQEDAAVDLLMSHLRSTGGLSPLPYTKLLEIYKRQGDHEAYERIRTRFNRRFNVYAPDWDPGPSSGRALEDYDQVMHQVQRQWASPLDAMATLEAMLFRRDEAHELFDLPAYKDVLLLYALARDLWQQGGHRVAPIDVLLPLSDEAADAEEPVPTAPTPLVQSAYVLAPPAQDEPSDDTPPSAQRRDET